CILFCQAEDGIRDRNVTGVQTCALPIYYADRTILTTMIEKFGGGPVGLDTLAAAIGEDSGTLEDVYEPFLPKNGFIQRTPKGRKIGRASCRERGEDSGIGESEKEKSGTN